MVTLPSSYFDAMYDVSPDPWGFQTRWYEQRKYALTLASLPDRRYTNGFEPACSIGVLSGQLADRCDRLLCSDGAQVAVQQAAQRLADRAHVTVEQRRLPDQWPPGAYDLIVVSELLYYFDGADLHSVTTSATSALSPGGTLVAAHWRHPVDDYPETGDAVHEALAAAAARASLVLLAHHDEADFLLDVYVRPGQDEPATPSVASREGLV